MQYQQEPGDREQKTHKIINHKNLLKKISKNLLLEVSNNLTVINLRSKNFDPISTIMCL